MLFLMALSPVGREVRPTFPFFFLLAASACGGALALGGRCCSEGGACASHGNEARSSDKSCSGAAGPRRSGVVDVWNVAP